MTKPTDFAQLADALEEAAARSNPMWDNSVQIRKATLHSAATALRAAGEDARDAARWRAAQNVFPCVRIKVNDDGKVTEASLYAPGLPEGEFNVYPIGIEDCAAIDSQIAQEDRG